MAGTGLGSGSDGCGRGDERVVGLVETRDSTEECKSQDQEQHRIRVRNNQDQDQTRVRTNKADASNAPQLDSTQKHTPRIINSITRLLLQLALHSIRSQQKENLAML